MKLREQDNFRKTMYTTKLQLINDYHTRKHEQKNGDSNLFGDIMRLLAMKLISDPPVQIFPFTSKNLTFDNFVSKKFFIKYHEVPKGKCFILKIIASVETHIQMVVDQKRPIIYTCEGQKAIVIKEKIWEKIQIEVRVNKMGIFSVVKLSLEHMQIEHKTNKKSSVNLRPNIDQELNEYLVTNRGKSAQILRTRSLIKLKNKMDNQSRATLTTAPIDHKIVRAKSQLLRFQRSKSQYLQHVKRMSPQKIQVIANSRNEYQIKKSQYIRYLAKIVFASKFAILIKNQRIAESRLKLHKIKIVMLCKDFIKIIKNKFKLRMTEKARSRMTMLRSLKLIPHIFYPSAFEKAKSIFLQTLKPFMNFRMVQQLGANSDDFIKGVQKIQRYAKQKQQALRKRAKILLDKLCEKQLINVPQQMQKQLIKQYLDIVGKDQRTITPLFTKKKQLIQMMRLI